MTIALSHILFPVVQSNPDAEQLGSLVLSDSSRIHIGNHLKGYLIAVTLEIFYWRRSHRLYQKSIGG